MVLETFAISLGASTAYGLSAEALKKALVWARKKRPELEAKAEAATNSGNVSAAEKVFKEAIGFIIAEADDGTLEIDRATLKALKVIQFDHQNGKILIGSTSISSKVLITGGSKGATGTTTIGGNTNLKSAGTEIKVGQDALIKMTGNAKITQN